MFPTYEIPVPYNGGTLQPKLLNAVLHDTNSIVYATSQTDPDIVYFGFAEYARLAVYPMTILNEDMISFESGNIASFEGSFLYQLTPTRYVYMNYTSPSPYKYGVYVADLIGGAFQYVAHNLHLLDVPNGTRPYNRAFLYPLNANEFLWFVHNISTSVMNVFKVTISGTDITSVNVASFSHDFLVSDVKMTFDVDENGIIWIPQRNNFRYITSITSFDPVTYATNTLTIPFGSITSIHVMRSNLIFAIPAGITFVNTYYLWDGSTWNTKSISQGASTNYYVNFKLENDTFGLISAFDDTFDDFFIKLFRYDGSDLLVSPLTDNNNGLYYAHAVSSDYDSVLNFTHLGNKPVVRRDDSSFIYFVTVAKSTDMRFVSFTVKGS